MSEIVNKLPGNLRLIPPNDRENVEHTYNLGVYRLEQDPCEVDTDHGGCLYRKYCEEDYGWPKDEEFISIHCNFIKGMLDASCSNFGINDIEDLIQCHLKDSILDYDESFEEHLKLCPAGNPEPVTDREEPAELWCKYLIEREK